MNTKTFAQEARKILMQGVAKKLLYWGFNAKGDVLEQPEKVSGGYSFRGEVFDDPSAPNLWHSLENAIKSKGIDVVVEEAAYTWFNRIMALRILTKNGYEEPQLEDAEGLEHTPIILQKARQGKSDFLTTEEKNRLQKILTDYSKDQEAFAILIKGYCHSHKTLQRVFGKIDDYTELLLPDNMLQTDGFLHLLNTTDAISDEDYQKVELIGWLYQFYISEKKDDVFASFKKGKKAEAKDIPAATQIFTPNWIVKYMVENTAGKIWLDKHPNSGLKTQMKYLVTNDNNENECHSELVEESLINTIEDLTLIDPAAGSGHILVEGFDLIYKMYLEEYYSAEEAVESILKNNLFGLDIDDRAAQLATFAILLKAAKVYPSIWKKDWLPNVYAMPEDELQDWFTTKSYDFSGDWIDLQGMLLAEPITIEYTETKKGKEKKQKVTFKKGNILNEKVVEVLRDHNKLPITVDYSNQLELFWGDFEKPYNYADFFYAMQLLRQGKNLGSVIKCNIYPEVRNHIESRYNLWLEKEKNAALDIEEISILNTLKSYIPVLLLLTKKYTSVVANPPYMVQTNMNINLKEYVNKNYPIAKSDLYSVFIESMISMLKENARVGCITMDSWMFKVSYVNFRKNILNNYSMISLSHFGWHIIGIAFGTAILILESSKKNYKGEYSYLEIEDVDKKLGKPSVFPLKNNNKYNHIYQKKFLKIPDFQIIYWMSEKVLDVFSNYEPLKNYAEPKKGITTSSDPDFVRSWFEVSATRINFSAENGIINKGKWFPVAKGGPFRKWFGNLGDVLNWENDGLDLKSFRDENNRLRSACRNLQYNFERGLTWNDVSSLGFACRLTHEGILMLAVGPRIYNSFDEYLLMCLLNSKIGTLIFDYISPGNKFEVGKVSSFPILKEIINLDFEINKSIAVNSVQISKKDWDSRETSWDFEQSPLLNTTNSLEEAYAKWQTDVTKDFFQLHSNEEELNRIFIEIYELQDEITPEVPLKDITILQEELNGKDLEKLEPTFRTEGAESIVLPINKTEVISQFISYAIGVFMGRYRLDKPGLNIAHPNPTQEELGSYNYNNGKITIDEDAVLPLMGTACNFPDDALQQIYNLLDVVWSAETRTDNINFIQECLNKDLEKFLVKDFYKYHCKMYKKKPIYWLFASKKGAFQVLVYMHRMNAFTVEKIRDNYLLEHIKNIDSEITLLSSNEANLNTQEAKKLEQLRKDLQECYEYEAELKTVADNQITFDLDDGVTVNYKKFETVVAKIK
ncbi:BREX-1 system adenine-specific DNA-methyltransferase PglX [Winogradskyella sp.]|uniref:BREX-1 system adenine-specific DNA-methyltransferase PglX n=1 Tax=Winogradskyella sp. TaxID=1883156 RepID=UPI003AB5B9C1